MQLKYLRPSRRTTTKVPWRRQPAAGHVGCCYLCKVLSPEQQQDSDSDSARGRCCRHDNNKVCPFCVNSTRKCWQSSQYGGGWPLRHEYIQSNNKCSISSCCSSFGWWILGIVVLELIYVCCTNSPIPSHHNWGWMSPSSSKGVIYWW